MLLNVKSMICVTKPHATCQLHRTITNISTLMMKWCWECCCYQRQLRKLLKSNEIHHKYIATFNSQLSSLPCKTVYTQVNITTETVAHVEPTFYGSTSSTKCLALVCVMWLLHTKHDSTVVVVATSKSSLVHNTCELQQVLNCTHNMKSRPPLRCR